MLAPDSCSSNLDIFNHASSTPSFQREMQYLQLFNHNNVPNRFNRFILAQTLSIDGGPVYCLKWSPDGKHLAAASANGTIAIWELILSSIDRAQIDPDGFQVFKQDPLAIFKHNSTVNSLDWSPNGFLLSSSEDFTVKLWHINRRDCLHTYQFSSIITNARFLIGDDRFFVASQWDGGIFFLSILEKSIVFEKSLPIQITCFDLVHANSNPNANPNANVNSNAETNHISTDSNINVVIGGDKGWIYVLDLMKSFDILASYQIKNHSNNCPRVTGIECFYDSNSPLINPNFTPKLVGKIDLKILITTNDSRIRLINYSARCLEVRYSGFENKSSNIKASTNDDRTYVISGSEDGWVYIWDTYNSFRKWGDQNQSINKDSNQSQQQQQQRPSISRSNSKRGSNFSKKSSSSLKSHNKFIKLLKPLSNIPLPNLPFVDDVEQVKNGNYSAWHLFHGKTNITAWGPRSTSKLLELSDDPIWELYLSGKHLHKAINEDSNLNLNSMSRSIEPVNEDLSLDNQFGSSILVAADNQGTIKVLRLDFAYEFRKLINKRDGKPKRNKSEDNSIGAMNRTKSLLRGRTRTNSTNTDSTSELIENYNHNLNLSSVPSLLMPGTNTGSNEDSESIYQKLGLVLTNNNNNSSGGGSGAGGGTGLISSVSGVGTITASDDSSRFNIPMIYQSGPDEKLRRRQQLGQRSGVGGENYTNNINSVLETAITNSIVKDDEVDDELRKLMERHQTHLKNGNVNGNNMDKNKVMRGNNNNDNANANGNEDTNEPLDTFKCKRCNGNQFTTLPMTSGNTNKINFYCKNCGESYNNI